ncbi:MAG: M14 family metallopeptidase [Acidimicrobiia bacterium]
MRLAQDYTEARGRFLDAAHDRGIQVEQHPHPLAGPAGEALSTDVAVIGSPDAPTRLLVISGTHGVEGFAGSLCQTEWLRSAASVPDDLAVVLVHAINPYGFAWIRRVNEDNVDLNRNCIDFGASLPENPGYDQLADALVPRTWDEPTQQATAGTLLEFATEHGFDALQAAVSMGQYRHSTGVFYGGTGPVWSQRSLESIARGPLAGAQRTGIIDLHTGLGPFGVGELIASHPDSSGRERLDAWFGEYTVPSEGTSVSADVSGDVLDGLDAWVESPEVTGIAIEWGTVDIIEVSNALRADAWLHAHADPLGSEAGPIKAALRAAFAPDDPQWAAMVWDRFVDVTAAATEGILA